MYVRCNQLAVLARPIGILLLVSLLVLLLLPRTQLCVWHSSLTATIFHQLLANWIACVTLVSLLTCFAWDSRPRSHSDASRIPLSIPFIDSRMHGGALNNPHVSSLGDVRSP